MKVLKRISCVLLAALVLCMPVIRTYRAHAEALTASYLAAYAVLGTALTACGIYVAASAAGAGVTVSDALGAAWDLTTESIKEDIRNIKLSAGVAGGLIAHWTGVKWRRFTSWVRSTFNPAADNYIPLPITTSWADSVVSQTSYNTSSVPRISVITGRDLSPFDYQLNSSRNSALRLSWDSSGNLYALLMAASSVLFTSASSAQIYRTMSGNFPSISVFKPISVATGTVYVLCASSYGATASTYNSDYNLKAQLTGWRFGSGCGNASIVGKQLVMENGVLRAGIGGLIIGGTWRSISDYIGACIDAGVVIGIPLDDGTTHSQDDVINTGSDSIKVDVDSDFFPRTGAQASEDDLPDDVGYDVYIDTATDYTGPDVYVKDVTDGSIDVDLDRLTDKTAADTRPRVRTDAGTTAVNGTTAAQATTATYFTTAKSAEIPSELVDQTIAQPPPGGGGEEEEEEDGNNLKLPALMLTKFPFCIPHDFKVAVEQLVADPAPPKFDFRLKIDSLGLNYVIPVDFSSFESIAYFVRWLIAAFWVIILIRGTLRLINV